jgi:zinc transport system permease protein
MISFLSDILSYTFMVRAIIVGILISLCASLLGVSLVLKHLSMIGDGLSHVGFGALAVAAALNWTPMWFAIPVCIAAAFILLRLSENTRIKGDAAIAMVSSGALAVGIMVISRSTGMSTDVYNYMFGSILSLSADDAILSVILSVCVLILFILFYPRLFAITFDETFSQATGIHTGLYNSALAVLTAVTVVIGMRMMGAMLISSLIIFPALTAMRIFRHFKSVTICSAVTSVICFLIGMFISVLLETPSGASVVCVDIAAFIIFMTAGKIFILLR